MSVRDIPEETQRELAQEFARLILHDVRTARDVADEFDMPEWKVRYLMRKHGFGSVRGRRGPWRSSRGSCAIAA